AGQADRGDSHPDRAARRAPRAFAGVRREVGTMKNRYRYFEAIEKHAGLLAVLIGLMVAIGGLAEITPLFMRAHETQPAPGIEPYDALRLAGRDIYVREGCHVCHSQMVRTLDFETARYGNYSVAGEFVYDRPFQWGSKR